MPCNVTWRGAWRMGEAITDTGPVLHLNEIWRLESLRVFERLVMPDLVAEELCAYGLDPYHLGVTGLKVAIVIVERTEWSPVFSEADQPTIHPADAQVFVLARSSQFEKPVLTDDLALRRRLESQGATVVGSVGVLVRAYTTGYLKRNELESAVDALLTTSTLHMSRAFKAYVRHLLAELP
jgi:predicted nucleic acid-binding protein